MRGKAEDLVSGLCEAGITPAHAGKSKEKEMSLYKL